MTRGALPAAAAALATAIVAAALLVAANNRVLLSGGSDALSTVLAPPVAGQVVAASLAALLAGIAMLWRGVLRPACAAVAVALLLLAAHRVVIDRASLEMRESWALVTLQRLALPDDAEARVDIAEGAWTLRLTAAPDATMTVLRGPPGLALAARP